MLPSPGNGVHWRNYKITTPTFKLSPVEKPDTSPFLIHMTGKNSLKSILKGENAPEDISVPAGYGFLKSCKPDYESSDNYNSKVVCFTESPIFALDFFRYRSCIRWLRDHKYGIGFSKDDLIRYRGVRPVVYLDSQTNRKLLSLCHDASNLDFVFSENQAIDDRVRNVLNTLKPLLFPMLEDNPKQGFMWEREWRYPFEDGMSFPLGAIKVICCPENEKDEIFEVLGEHIVHVSIVETWRDYDEVTDYLTRRNREYNPQKIDQIEQITNIAELESLKQQNDRTLNSLEGYLEIFKGKVEVLEGNNIYQIIEDMKRKSHTLKTRIAEVSDLQEKQMKQLARKAYEELQNKKPL